MSAGLVARRRTAAIGARMTPRPFGYLLLSVSATTVGWVSVAALVEPAYGADGVDALRQRAVAGVVAAASLVAAEALWCVRPWVVRACMAYLLLLGAATVCLGAPYTPRELGWTLVAVAVALLCLAPLPRYVARRADRLFGRGAGGAGTP